MTATIDAARTAPCDLTILTLFSGNRILLGPFADALYSLKKPTNTQLLFIDNSGDSLFYQKLIALGGETCVFPDRLESGVADDLRREAQIRKAEHCSNLYNFSKPYIRGENLLILEHDVIPAPEALEKLSRSRDYYRADLMSAAIVSRTTGEYLGWRFKRNGADIDRVPVTRHPKRVMATGFGFLLMKKSTFLAMRITAQDSRYPFFGCDLHAGVWAREKNLRWFMDGGVRCAHLTAAGVPARFGYPANSGTGPLHLLRDLQEAV